MINNLNLQRLQTAAGYSPMAKDTYTTLPEKSHGIFGKHNGNIHFDSLICMK